MNIFKMETILRLQTKIIIWKQLLKKNMLEFSCAVDSSWKYRSMRKYYFSSLYSENVYISILASLQIEVIGEFYKFSLQPSLNISSSFMSGFFFIAFKLFGNKNVFVCLMFKSSLLESVIWFWCMKCKTVDFLFFIGIFFHSHFSLKILFVCDLHAPE